MKFGSTVLFVDDVPTVLAFYKKAFGFETTFYDEKMQFGELDAGGMSLAISSHATGEYMMPSNYQHPSSGKTEGIEIAFYLEDVATAFDRAVKAGATNVAKPKKMPWGQTVAYVRSVEGTVIGLCTPLSK